MFHRRLKDLRKERSMTQSELGARLSLSKQTISGYETGDISPNDKTLVLLADIFNVSTDYLLGRTDTRDVDRLSEQPATYSASSDIIFPPIDVGGKKLEIATKRRDVDLALDDFLDTIKQGLEQELLTEEQAETAIKRFHETLKTSIEIFRK